MKSNIKVNTVAKRLIGKVTRNASLYTVDDIKTIIKDLKEDLRDELADSTFSNVEEVKGFIREKLLDAMYMTEDTASLAAYYVNPDTLRKLFYKQFVNDVVSQLGDLKQYVTVVDKADDEEMLTDTE